jgi:hypothetical protein
VRKRAKDPERAGRASTGPTRPLPAKDSRDERPWELLPSKDAPYDYYKLSKNETDALVEALADGFGDVLQKAIR